MKQNYQPDWNINWSIYQNIELVVKPTAVVHSSVMSIILQPSATDKVSAIHIVINKKNIQLMSQSYKLDFWSNIQESFFWACWSLGISPHNNWWFDVCIFNRCGNNCFMFALGALQYPSYAVSQPFKEFVCEKQRVFVLNVSIHCDHTKKLIPIWPILVKLMAQ